MLFPIKCNWYINILAITNDKKKEITLKESVLPLCLICSSNAEVRPTAENRNKQNANINGHLLFFESLISGWMTISDGLMIYWNHNSFVYVRICALFLDLQSALPAVLIQFLFYLTEIKTNFHFTRPGLICSALFKKNVSWISTDLIILI